MSANENQGETIRIISARDVTPALTKACREAIARAAAIPDDRIDLSHIPRNSRGRSRGAGTLCASGNAPDKYSALCGGSGEDERAGGREGAAVPDLHQISFA